MGCVQTVFDLEEEPFSDCLTPTETGIVDITKFKLMPFLGIGGSGLVRAVKKLTGQDRNSVYALKSLRKSALLQKSSGPVSAITELRILSTLDCPFICNCHYAFQDNYYLYFVLDFVVGGDMKYNLRNSPAGRFSEETR